MTASIRPVAARDYPVWLCMRQKIYPGLSETFHRQEMRLYGKEPDKACYIAHLQDQIVAFIEVSLRNVVDGCLSSPVGYIEGIYVEPEYRGQGIGGALLRHVEAWFRTQGCSEMATDALAEDESAQRFHAHVGFTETFRIVQFKRDLDSK